MVAQMVKFLAFNGRFVAVFSRLICVLSQTNPVHNFLHYLLKIRSNIILASSAEVENK
jgi:hypothetical protein